MKKRELEVAVISGVHLGTYGCHTDELLTYLNSIKPRKLVLNGDILDVWNFKTHYFPPAHLNVLRKIIGLASRGTEVYYIPGNHDQLLRRFGHAQMGNISIDDQLVLNLDGKKAWFYHGDVFDVSIQNAKWLARLGGQGCALLIRINRVFNWGLTKLGREKFSISKRVKKGEKSAIKYIRNFEETVSNLAIDNGYDYVVCGHLHQPKKEIRENRHGQCTHLNSGDWVENLTAPEYSFKRWKIYRYNHDKLSAFYADGDLKEVDIDELIDSITDMKAEKKKEKDEKSLED
ncbi:MAG TPA: UDP-2,3-diacylglucosamine diphosphatase [Eudoraea sp.]|nr:UDP-2,3-diacylglucosamine diphosphatase [Eudoraea sp.]